MNFTELIAPFEYELNTERMTSLLADETTQYETKNADKCHDMLELILRAFYNDCSIPILSKKDYMT